MKELGIYIHIPFCVRKCLYCDFLSAPGSRETIEQYVAALCREIQEESKGYVSDIVDTVFLGGGTPSLLSGKQLGRILDTLRENYRLKENCEISMELNPGTATEKTLNAYHQAGVNRLSIGLQSAVEEELRSLGRIHSSEDFYRTYGLAVKTGFNNINVDVMSGIPGQDLRSWEYTLKQVTGLCPAPVHISAYSLIVEEGTPFYENTPELPDEDTEREMYKITGDFLKKLGYGRYEISNYARAGYECRHNCRYWERKNYVGFGIGAASMVENVRWRNASSLTAYLERGAVKKDWQKLSKEEQMEEFMFLGLRMMKGVSPHRFYQLYGRELEEVFPGVVKRYQELGLLDISCPDDKMKKRIHLTGEGISVSNVIMADFLLPE